MVEYRSFRKEVLKVLNECKKEFCEGVGALGVAEAQSRTVVDSGNLRRSETYEVMQNNEGVYIGVLPSADYGLLVEKGIGQPAQPFLEPAITASIPQIVNIAESIYRSKVGGD